jgi:Ankyrin repeats (many copies)
MFKRLRWAIEQNNIFQFSEMLDRLLADKSFDLNREDEYGRTLLGSAVEDGRLEIIKILLDRGIDVNSSDYALHLAIEYANLQVIDLLLDRGANIDRLERNGCTPILLAVSDGIEDISMRLIRRGADINIANYLGLKPIHYALAWNLNRAINSLQLSEIELLEERSFLELHPRFTVNKTLANSELLEIEQRIHNSDPPLSILINFFALLQLQQSVIMPQLTTVTKFDFREGDVVTNSSLDVLGCGYEQLLRNLVWLIEDELRYSQPIFRVICHAAHNICHFIYMTCENSKGDNYFEDDALSSNLFSVIRYLSRFIRSYLDIERSISTSDLQMSIDYYLHS